METSFIKKHQGSFLIGLILLWYIVATIIDLIWLKDSRFSKLFILNEAYLGMKPIGLPLPESGILLFIIGSFPLIIIQMITTNDIERTQPLKSILGIIGFTFLIFVLLIPILVIGEIIYKILIEQLCGSVSWLNWFKEVLDLFTFKANIQASFIKNPITIDMSLGGFLALYIGIPIIRKKIKI